MVLRCLLKQGIFLTTWFSTLSVCIHCIMSIDGAQFRGIFVEIYVSAWPPLLCWLSTCDWVRVFCYFRSLLHRNLAFYNNIATCNVPERVLWRTTLHWSATFQQPYGETTFNSNFIHANTINSIYWFMFSADSSSAQCVISILLCLELRVTRFHRLSRSL